MVVIVHARIGLHQEFTISIWLLVTSISGPSSVLEVILIHLVHALKPLLEVSLCPWKHHWANVLASCVLQNTPLIRVTWHHRLMMMIIGCEWLMMSVDLAHHSILLSLQVFVLLFYILNSSMQFLDQLLLVCNDCVLLFLRLASTTREWGDTYYAGSWVIELLEGCVVVEVTYGAFVLEIHSLLLLCHFNWL